jgi:hypothetical protein
LRQIGLQSFALHHYWVSKRGKGDGASIPYRSALEVLESIPRSAALNAPAISGERAKSAGQEWRFAPIDRADAFRAGKGRMGQARDMGIAGSRDAVSIRRPDFSMGNNRRWQGSR